MIFIKKIDNPYEWHKFFTLKPVLLEESLSEVCKQKLCTKKTFPFVGISTPTQTVLCQKYAMFTFVERKLETNLTGTRRWIFRKM